MVDKGNGKGIFNRIFYMGRVLITLPSKWSESEYNFETLYYIILKRWTLYWQMYKKLLCFNVAHRLFDNMYDSTCTNQVVIW